MYIKVVTYTQTDKFLKNIEERYIFFSNNNKRNLPIQMEEIFQFGANTQVRPYIIRF